MDTVDHGMDTRGTMVGEAGRWLPDHPPTA
jgi:hypothetical protein